MVEQDLKGFYESVSAELIGIKDRVRNIIGAANWGVDGTYKEAILRNIISKLLPKNYSISTGFVINADREITTQLDLIIYDDASPVLFKEGDFAIVLAHTVWGIIEVKTRFSSWSELNVSIEKAKANGSIIHSTLTKGRKLFNGVFAYEIDFEINEPSKRNLAHFFSENDDLFRTVNNVALGKNYFLHLHYDKNPRLGAYALNDLSFAYFISNLLERVDSNPIFFEHNRLFFPLDSKEPHLIFSINKDDVSV